jgi:hypothetical protein
MGETEAETPLAPETEAQEAPEPTEELAPEAPAPAGWSADDPAFREAVAEEAAHIARAQIEQTLAGLAQQQQEQGYYGQEAEQQGYPDFNLDPLEEGFGQNLAQMIAWNNQQLMAGIQQMVGQALGPVYEQQDRGAIAEGTERMKDILSDLAAREGDFSQDAAQRVAPMFLAAAETRYGEGTRRSAEAALTEAARFVRSLEREAEKRGADRLRNELSGKQGLPVEPGTGGAAVSTKGIEAHDEVAWAQKWLQARGAS